MKLALLAKGKTLEKYPGKDGFTQVWGLNQLGQSHELDRLYVMDDLELRLPYYDPGSDFHNWLKTYPGRLITSKAYPDYPTSEDYPLVEIAKFFGLPLGIAMYSTVDYMIAHAIYEGFDEIHMFGVDCNAPGMEQIRTSAGIWIGAAMARGIQVVTLNGSAFRWWTYAGRCLEQGLYGYVGRPRIEELVGESSTAPP